MIDYRHRYSCPVAPAEDLERPWQRQSGRALYYARRLDAPDSGIGMNLQKVSLDSWLVKVVGEDKAPRTA
jgi:hypothetical protein